MFQVVQVDLAVIDDTGDEPAIGIQHTGTLGRNPAFAVSDVQQHAAALEHFEIHLMHRATARREHLVAVLNINVARQTLGFHLHPGRAIGVQTGHHRAPGAIGPHRTTRGLELDPRHIAYRGNRKAVLYLIRRQRQALTV